MSRRPPIPPAPPPLDPALARRVEELVRPLYVGLDGAAGFDRVAPLARHAAALAGAPESENPADGRPLDRRLLALLILFHGAVDRLGSLGPGGRLDLFLRGAGVEEELARRLRAGLGRLTSPGSPTAGPLPIEEAVLHDALLLDGAGVAAAAERLMAAGKRRQPLARALAQLDPGAPSERYRTAAGRRSGAARRQAALAWIEDLRRRIAEEERGTV
ncbi:MAG TPA: hypothetical protein VFI63_04230 [Solirubrobacterales bacterium]|nr:hypothetical protein [Solirubrobacterales bacterium]